MMMKMTSGQMMSVRDHSYNPTHQKTQDEDFIQFDMYSLYYYVITPLAFNRDPYAHMKTETMVPSALLKVTHRLSDDLQPVLPEKKPQLLEECHW